MSLFRSRKTENGPRVEINVVPLVDVALVLLIIFMITATFAKSAGMHIQLPTSSATEMGEEVERELLIGIDSNGGFLWHETSVEDAELLAALMNEAREHGTGSRVVIQGDKKASHGRVVRAMSFAQEAGFGNQVIATRKELSAID